MIHCFPSNNAKWRVLDGCQSGWIAAEVLNAQKTHIYHVSKLTDLTINNQCLNFIDIPIRLPKNINEYPRLSDKKTKSLLGCFHSSIFYAPLEEWLNKEYESINKECSFQNKPKLSKQSFNLFKKIKAVQVVYKEHPKQWIEIHPELLVHYYLKNEKIKKTTVDGQLQRLDILTNQLNLQISLNDLKLCYGQLKSEDLGINLAMDDIIDALFCAACIKKNNGYKFITQNGNIETNDINNRLGLFK